MPKIRSICLAIPGRLKTVPMSTFAAEAFRTLGCTVHVINTDPDSLTERIHLRLSRKGFLAKKNRSVLEQIESLRPDLFFAIYAKTLTTETIQSIRQRGIATACWWLNDPFQFSSAVKPPGRAAAFHLYYTNATGMEESYAATGVPGVRFLPVGISPALHHPPVKPCEPIWDVLFAGDWHPIRQQALELLIPHCKVAIMGPWDVKKTGKDSPVRNCIVHQGFFTPLQMVAAFHKSAIILNLHTWFGRWDHGINPRLFEAAACQAFQLVDMKREIPALFPSGSMITFDRLDELPGLVKHYLANRSEREHIAATACQQAHACHLYTHRMQQVLEDAAAIASV